MPSRVILSAAVAGSFIAGFAVAELTGVRALGGLVLLAGGASSTRIALRITGPVSTAALVAIALALFVFSHPLGHAIGAWPAVLVSAALAAAAAFAVTRIWRKTDPAAVGSRIAPPRAVVDDQVRGPLAPDRR